MGEGRGEAGETEKNLGVGCFTLSCKTRYKSLKCTMITSFVYSPELDADEASSYLKKHNFPANKWKELAAGLRLASTAGTIEATCCVIIKMSVPGYKD